MCSLGTALLTIRVASMSRPLYYQVRTVVGAMIVGWTSDQDIRLGLPTYARCRRGARQTALAGQ